MSTDGSANSIDSTNAETVESLREENRRLRQRVQDYDHTLRTTKRRLYSPSFVKELESYKDYIRATSGIKEYVSLPSHGMTSKLIAYESIQSHGFHTPDILQVWPRLDDMQLESLPDSFVLKSDGGASSEGVLPLQRDDSGNYRIVGGGEKLSESEIRERFARSFSAGSAYGVLFAEELLGSRDGSSGIPNDVKLYASYGVVTQVLLRSVDVHGELSETRSKYVTPDGKSLGQVATHRQLDDSISVPTTLPEMVEVAKHLSRASGLPFCRVDLYDSTKGVVAGEITRAPGGSQAYTEEHDAMMATAWHRANANLLLDYQNGRPVGTIWGHHSVHRLHPVGPARPLGLPGTHLANCTEWCIK